MPLTTNSAPGDSTSGCHLLKKQACWGGWVGFFRHDSPICHSSMSFAVYQPPQAQQHAVPVLYCLAGLTCTEETFLTKAGALKRAAQLGVMLVMPDTSPRHTGIPQEDSDGEVGSGAGFYLDATQDPWARHFRMYSYVVEELPALIQAEFPALGRQQGILGHSMGGHGALICALKNPDRYRSVSALAPIAAPMRCPWGQKAFRHYLGSDLSLWRDWDACQLLLDYGSRYPSILVDQGTEDIFLSQQLLPDHLESACAQVGQSLQLRRQIGYDHSYYFVNTFIEDHLDYHASFLL
ncbi:MAG: S-formylglutathione hydrolase [Cyanobacteriota bacterium]|nr:S-formylglutathione hydrolase [Cyanobacteriota bacterium]